MATVSRSNEVEGRRASDREIAIFERTFWAWLGGAALLLLLSQAVLLQWGLTPLRRDLVASHGGELKLWRSHGGGARVDSVLPGP